MIPFLSHSKLLWTGNMPIIFQTIWLLFAGSYLLIIGKLTPNFWHKMQCKTVHKFLSFIELANKIAYHSSFLSADVNVSVPVILHQQGHSKPWVAYQLCLNKSAKSSATHFLWWCSSFWTLYGFVQHFFQTAVCSVYLNTAAGT